MAQLGSLEVSVFALEAGSILVSSQKGWEGEEVGRREESGPTNALAVCGFTSCLLSFPPFFDGRCCERIDGHGVAG